MAGQTRVVVDLTDPMAKALWETWRDIRGGQVTALSIVVEKIDGSHDMVFKGAPKDPLLMAAQVTLAATGIAFPEESE
jgi:hypothetical protein